MEPAFNPYIQWLGYSGKRPETYYELLGLKHHESNVERIAHAADELLAKVRAMPPGDHFIEWEQLLTELQVAKNCLCNPKYKAKYDEEHPSPSASASPSLPDSQQPFQQNAQNAGMPPQQGMMGMQPGMMPGMMQPGMVQPGMMPQGMMPGMMQPGMVQPGMYGGGMYPQMYAPVYPQAPMQGTPVQNQPPQGGVVTPLPGYGAATVGTAVPTPKPASAPTSSPLGGVVEENGSALPNIVTDAPSFSSSVPSSSSSPSAKRGGKNNYGRTGNKPAGKAGGKAGGENRVQILVAAAGVGLLAFVALLFAFQKEGPQIANNAQPTEEEASNDSEPSFADAATQAMSAPPVEKPASRPKPIPSAENAGPSGPIDPEATEAAAAASARAFSGNTSFKIVRSLLASQDVETAKDQLEAIKPTLTKDVEKEEWERLSRIAELIQTFSTSLGESMGKFTAGASYKIGASEEEVSVVTSEPNRLVLFVRGEHAEFTPLKLRAAGLNIVDFIYNNEIRTSRNYKVYVQYGAYLVMIPGSDHKLVRQLWDVASKKGEDTRILYPELDQYEDSFGGPKRRSIGDLVNQETPPEETEKTSGSDSGSAGEKDASTDAKKDGAGSKKGATGGGSGGSGADGAEDESGAKKPDEAEARKEKARAAELKKFMAGIRHDISWRELDNAKKKINAARKIIKTEEENAELNRLDALAQYMEAFVTWVGSSMGSYRPTSTVNVGGEDLAVVESFPGRLVVRIRGQNRTFTTDTLNPRLVEFLVSSSLSTSADNHVLYGTYLAMDPDGDRTKARELWKKAKEMGFDTDSLLPELDVPLPDSGRRPGGGQSEASRGGNAPAAPQEIPTGETKDKALAKIKQEFEKDYAKTSLRDQLLLSEKLLNQARSSSRPADEAYVLAQEAIRVGTACNSYDTIYNAYALIQERFGEDTYEARIAFVTKADPAARGSATKRELAECATKLGLEAVSRKKKIQAIQLLDIAQKNASGSQVRKALELKQWISQMR
ncbi:MAG: hypothetical protein Q4D38_07475 [Planctomycetia bacterium]|nr:hypothetical protein [Planctomycetia bacterium]